MESKIWYTSKTLWLNIAGIALIGLQVVLNSKTLVDPDAQAIVLAIANIIMRFQSSQSLTLTK